jgi:predicted transcriptional regulator
MTQQRAVIRIQLDPQAKRLLDQLCEQRGMTQIAVLSRAVSWLTRQNNLIQTAILGGLSPEDQAELAKLLLKRMSKGSEPSDAARNQLAPPAKRRARRDKPPASNELPDATE